MKKVMITIASFFLLAGTASAALIEDTATTTIGNETFGISTGVKMDLDTSASEYAVAAKHTQGVTLFFTEESSTKITPVTGCTPGHDVSASTVSGATTNTAPSCP